MAEDPGAREIAIQSGLKNPAAWGEVLALTVGQLAPDQSDALIRRISEAGEAGRLLLHRVLADAEGLNPETVLGVLGLERGRNRWRQRLDVIEQLPALVGDGLVAVRLLDRLRRTTTDGNDLYWVRETLRGLEAVASADAQVVREAADARARLFDHMEGRRSETLALLKPWWRPVPPKGERLGPYWVGDAEYDHEKPMHNVTLTAPYQILGVPVTWAMYLLFDPGHATAQDTFDGNLPAGNAQVEIPVYCVTWYAATMFAAWVGARLPMEPEWEIACRAGTSTRYWSGNQETDRARVGWYRENSGGLVHPVAEKPANAWGLHDVYGNVWEWCQDCDRPDAYAAWQLGVAVDPATASYQIGKCAQVLPELGARDDFRMLRGGSWGTSFAITRSADRGWEPPEHANLAIGFRLVLPVPASEP